MTTKVSEASILYYIFWVYNIWMSRFTYFYSHIKENFQKLVQFLTDFHILVDLQFQKLISISLYSGHILLFITVVLKDTFYHYNESNDFTV